MSLLWPRAQALATALPPLLMAADKALAPVGRGSHGRRRAGSGDAFWQFRDFHEGDTQANIDWRRSARSHRHLFVRQTEWEAQQTLWLWCDGSASMDFSGGAAQSKRDRALIMALALAHAAAEAGERVGALHPGARAAAGRYGTRSVRQHLTDEVAEPDFTPVKPRHHMLLVSDFLMTDEALHGLLQAAGRTRAHLHLLHILSPAEMDFPFTGRLRLIDPEGSENELVERGEDMAAGYARARQAWQDRLNRLALGLKASFTLHRTDKPAAPVLLRMAHAMMGAP